MQLNDVGVVPCLAAFSAEVTVGIQIHLIGPNGAGKSTLLARIAGLLPGEGEIILSGKSLSAYQGKELARYRAYLSQQQFTATVMPVFQYLALHQPISADREAIAETIDYLCQKLRLTNKLSHKLIYLSGGEWQRVRLAAIFLQVWPSVNSDSKLLLLGEPTTSLDIAQKVAVDNLVKEFCQTGRSVIVSTHDLNHTLQQANQVWLLASGQVIAQGETRQVMQTTRLAKVFEIDFHIQNVNQRDWIIPLSA